jgi:hypothetical protein
VLDPLNDLFHIYPKAAKIFRDIMRTANLDKGIKSPEFQFRKERILILRYLLEHIHDLDKSQTQALVDAVLIRRDMPTILGLLKDFGKGDKGASLWDTTKERLKSSFGQGDEGGSSSAWRIVSWGSGSKSSKPITKEEEMWKDANNFASSVPDSRFLSQLKSDGFDECLRDAIVEAEETAYACLTTQIEALGAGISQQILSSQTGDYDKQVEREVNSEKDKELGVSRSDFVRQVEDFSRERSRSYVHHGLG